MLLGTLVRHSKLIAVVGIVAAIVCVAAMGCFDSALARAGSVVRGDAVASVSDRTLTTVVFVHWMKIAAKGNASQKPGTPVIVPTDPPDFAGCIAQVRVRIPSLASTSTARIRSDCRALFAALSAQVLSFLIEADWFEADAAIDHITVTNAQVADALGADKRKQFPTASAYRAFLKLTGQTNRDVLFRVRINLIYDALVKQAHGNSREVERHAREQFLATTSCARYYVMPDCANYRKNPATA